MTYATITPLAKQGGDRMAEDKDTNEMSAWITVKEAAEIAGVSEQGMRWLLKHKNIEGIKPGRDWLVSRASVETYKAERKAKEQ